MAKSNTEDQTIFQLKKDFGDFLDMYLSQSFSLEKLDKMAKELQEFWKLKVEEKWAKTI